MITAKSLDGCRAARVPRTELRALARLRRLPSIRIGEEADFAWVFWDAAAASVIQALMPVAGVVFYCRAGEHWCPLGAALSGLFGSQVRRSRR